MGIAVAARARLAFVAEFDGLPALYAQEDLHGAQLRPFEQAIERLLRAHEPYPA